MILFPTSFPSIWAWYKISTPKLKKNVLLSNGLWRPSWNLVSSVTCPRINSLYPPEIIIRDANEEDSAEKKKFTRPCSVTRKYTIWLPDYYVEGVAYYTHRPITHGYITSPATRENYDGVWWLKAKRIDVDLRGFLIYQVRHTYLFELIFRKSSHWLFWY